MSDDIAKIDTSEKTDSLVTPEAEKIARHAIADLNAGNAGELLGVLREDPHSITYRFSADIRGFRGWEWHVVLSGDTEHPTLNELALIPGDKALLAPPWIPWEERLQPGDLSDNDILPVADNDPRLVPGYMDSGDAELDDAAMPIGYGRERVLSPEGRDEAATRWEKSEYGPQSNRAKRAPAHCESCGFYAPLAGALKASFGVCTNKLSADGHVVHAHYGCGAHSSIREDFSAVQPAAMYFDDAEFDVVTVAANQETDKEEQQ